MKINSLVFPVLLAAGFIPGLPSAESHTHSHTHAEPAKTVYTDPLPKADHFKDLKAAKLNRRLTQKFWMKTASRSARNDLMPMSVRIKPQLKPVRAARRSECWRWRTLNTAPNTATGKRESSRSWSRRMSLLTVITTLISSYRPCRLGIPPAQTVLRFYRISKAASEIKIIIMSSVLPQNQVLTPAVSRMYITANRAALLSA